MIHLPICHNILIATIKTSGLLSHKTTLDSEGGNNRMTWGHHIIALIELECKLLDKLHSHKYSHNSIYREEKGTVRESTFVIQLDALTLCLLKINVCIDPPDLSCIAFVLVAIDLSI